MEHFLEGSAPLRFWQVNEGRFLLFVILMKKTCSSTFFLKEDLHDVIDLTFLIFGSVCVWRKPKLSDVIKQIFLKFFRKYVMNFLIFIFFKWWKRPPGGITSSQTFGSLCYHSIKFQRKNNLRILSNEFSISAQVDTIGIFYVHW